MFSNHSLPMCTLNQQAAKTVLLIAASALLLSSCAPAQNKAQQKSVAKPAVTIQKKPPVIRTSNLTLKERLALPGDQSAAPAAAAEPLYSFQARNMEINSALRLFAKAYKLNIVADKEVTGSVTVAFHDLSFEQSMQAILSSLGYYWQRDENLIRVRQIDERIFTINYLRLSRSDQGKHQATVSSITSGGGGGAGGVQGSSFSIGSKDEIAFWTELEEQMKTMVSKEDYARVTINKMSGTIQVVDTHSRVESIANFINKLNYAIKRQIEIEVQIVEVNLNEDFSLGIDWAAIDASIRGLIFSFSTNNIITTAIGGIPPKPPTIGAGVGYLANNGNGYASILTALKEQGDINIVSKPSIRTLNNQPAMIKVGTDRTYFSRKTIVTATVGGVTNNVNDTAQVITEGVVLSITPQIAEDNWVMMDISPVLTRVIGLSQTFAADGTVLSTAPNIDVRQSTSIVRVRDGQTIILGGLIQDIDSELERKVPGLGDIPAIGKAFTGQYEIKQKKELVIFMTPRVVGAVKAIEEAKL